MIVITSLCVLLLFIIDLLPYYLGLIISILLFQRILEFLIVYSRNFVLHKGRIFSDFKDDIKRGQWLILMFVISVVQINLVFAIWYRFLTTSISDAFSNSLTVLDSLYFSIITFMTIGYGDIVPTQPITKLLVLLQTILTFYTIFIVINGLIYSHFRGKSK